MIEILIPFEARTKKNSMQVGRNRYTGKTFVSQSKNYIQFERDCLAILPRFETIRYQCNLKCIFYMSTKRRIDLVNLLNSIQDILVKAEILEDDNSNIVVSVDGSRVFYDKENPRVEIFIEKC